ncbi:hypothetical protein [Pedosphaera parvula]|nr:hypothetical protein [Pedosphaera parvula]
MRFSRTDGFRLFCILLAACLFAPNLLAQKWNAANATPASHSDDKGASVPTSSSPRPRANSNRFLLAVDAAAPMKKQAPVVEEAINQILLSRASGQLYRGDTLGVWTFDTELHTGSFPLQVWTPEDEKAIATHVTEFLKKQRYGKQSRFDALLPSVEELVKQSDIITIIIISDGQNQMQGTPFDREINKSYQQILREMGNEQMPIVTVLQAQGGKFIKYNTTALPWPVIIPELPIPLKDESTSPASPAANVAKAKPTAQPLIVTGPKATQPVSANPATVPIPQPNVKSEAQVVSSTPAPSPAEKATVPAMVQTPPVITSPPPTPPQLPVQVLPRRLTSGSQPEAVPKAEISPASATPAVVQKTSTPPATEPPRTDAAVSAENKSSVVNAGTREVQPETTKLESSAAPAVPLAVVANSPAPARSKTLLIAAATLLVIAIGLTILMIRRSRTASGPSLITRSMDLRK